MRELKCILSYYGIKVHIINLTNDVLLKHLTVHSHISQIEVKAIKYQMHVPRITSKIMIPKMQIP